MLLRNFCNHHNRINTMMQERQAASGKPQAASGKRQATSGKRQATSGKRQAASDTLANICAQIFN